MKIGILVVTIWVIGLVEGQDLLVNSVKAPALGQRASRQTNADQMVQNILQWLQGVYTQNSRKIRQGTLREYLPPSNTQKPRPFEPQGYPPAGITPQPPFPIYTNPTTGAITSEGYAPPSSEISPPNTGYPFSPSSSPVPPFTGYPQTSPTGYPQTSPTGYPQTSPTGYPQTSPTRYPQTSPTGYPQSSSTHYPQTSPTGYPQTSPTGYPQTSPTSLPITGYPTNYPTGPSSTYEPSSTTGFSSPKPQPFPTYNPTTLSPDIYVPSTSSPAATPGSSAYYTSQIITTQSVPTERPSSTTPSTEDNGIEPTAKPEPTDLTSVTALPPSSDNDKHPPHIHAIEVECAKDMMTITIEFNREFNGVIYSKGYYSTPECRYVNENSGLTKYKFTVNLNSCGTEFINAFDTQGQSYLENILVIQNEQGIQEVWDTIRSVRCLWEGNLKDSLSVGLSVGMLSQEIVTFSGDTAMAKLDIQIGKGPFAPPANGLVKIGEPMTLVISVSGDPGFDLQVRDCKATDDSGDKVYPLTDDNGCILKPKLFGAFQKTRNTGDTGASIIAFAFFNAFKFPDVMDLMIQCNIELCKTDCQVCPEPNQQTEPGRRRRRDLYSTNNNSSISDEITMGKHLQVVLVEDLHSAGLSSLVEKEGVCMSTQSFVLAASVMISILISSTVISAYLWLKNQRLIYKF